LSQKQNIFANIDLTLVIIYIVLVLTGWLNIYAAVYNEQHNSIFDFTQNYGKQLIFIVSSFIIALFILVIDTKFFSQFAYLIYGIFLLLLVAVLGAGNVVSGSKSWFQIGGFALQPAEFAKFATALAMAKFLSAPDINTHRNQTKIIPLLLLGIPALLIFLQNDTGSALVFSSFVLVLYRVGLSGNLLLTGVGIALLFLVTLMFDKIVVSGIFIGFALVLFFFIKKNRKNILSLAGLLLLIVGFVFSVDYAFEHFLEDHQKTRINVLLGKEIDLKGAGYNVNQSKIAIGSGGFLGKGFLKGTQTKYNFVPEQSTDFIFCTVGEEWGFMGSVIVISLFIGLFSRLIILAERQRSQFSRLYGYGIASIMFFHFLVNIGMTIGLAPVIGIPLPFYSYGGSSLLAFTLMLFVFIKQDMNRLQLV
jgi:rod shape determining protein RodA